MRKQELSTRLRYAILRAHEGRCFYCRRPLEYLELQIDHILPRRLLDEPDKLRVLTRQLGLNHDFSPDSLQNLVPTHQDCNRRKSDAVYDLNALHFYLQENKKRLPATEKELQRLEKRSKRDEILASIDLGLESSLISERDLHSALVRYKLPTPVPPELTDPLVICFGVNTFELQETGELPPEAPSYYPELCDYLEQGLTDTLREIVSGPFFQPEISERSGETLSVRIAFTTLDLDEIDRLYKIGWEWEILEIAYYSEIYDEPFLATD